MAGDGGFLRTQEQIDNALIRSKLKLSDILPVTQIIKTNAKNFEKENYRLLELDSHLLQSLKCGDKVMFKGEDNDTVMLCSETRTYDIRECETSNSLIMVSNLKFHENLKNIEEKTISNVEIMGKNYKYMEVLPCQPPVKKILKMLEGTKYNGPEKEFMVDKSKLLSLDELLDKTQASEEEFLKLLTSIMAVNIDNKIRLLDVEYHFRVISFMLQSIEENSWALDEINKEVTISSWKEVVPEEILESVFNFYTTKSKDLDGIQLYQYKEDEVCRALGSVLLHHGTKFNLNDFMQAWKESVPEGMVPKEEMLYGIAVIDRTPEPNTIWAFSESDLPESLDARLQALFKVKPKWTCAEISPYIKCLTTDKLDANALLAKYCRASTINGVRYYGAKYL